MSRAGLVWYQSTRMVDQRDNALMRLHKRLIRRITWFLRRMFSRWPETGGVPPVGVREPRRRSPSGKGAAASVMEPDEYLVTRAVGKR